MPSPVRDNADLFRFELVFEDATAIANFRLVDGVMIFTHTEAPPQFRNRGIASQLVCGALEAVRARHLKVVPRCSFVAAHIARHVEFRDLLA